MFSLFHLINFKFIVQVATADNISQFILKGSSTSCVYDSQQLFLYLPVSSKRVNSYVSAWYKQRIYVRLLITLSLTAPTIRIITGPIVALNRK